MFMYCCSCNLSKCQLNKLAIAVKFNFVEFGDSVFHLKTFPMSASISGLYASAKILFAIYATWKINSGK